MIELIFEAHATSLDNEAGLASGWADVALPPLGEKQAKELGERYEGQHFDAIFCSDLQRAVRTAEIAFGDKFPIIKDKRLRECDYGDMTRTDKDAVEADRPNRIKVPFPNGESYQDCLKRMQEFMADLKRDYGGKRVMIIGHRATQYSIEDILNGVPLEKIVPADWRWQPGWKYEVVS